MESIFKMIDMQKEKEQKETWEDTRKDIIANVLKVRKEFIEKNYKEDKVNIHTLYFLLDVDLSFFLDNKWFSNERKSQYLYEKNLEKAFKNFLRNKEFGFPKYKCKSNPVQSYTTNNQGAIYIDKGYIKLPKLKSMVKIRLHREVKGIIKSVTISKNSLGNYFVSILCEEEIEELPKANKNIGIDLGIKDFAIMSDNTKVENLKLTKKYEDKLKREQRKLSKRREVAKNSDKKLKDSKNYQKQKKILIIGLFGLSFSGVFYFIYFMLRLIFV